ncbi:MAG: alpha/beta hydrolase [Phycisphaeraceae bacterium]|nr:alpha/beta hydrolase [Phycisphaeraceae bacterium]
MSDRTEPAFTIRTANDAEPEQTLLVAHGIYGRGRNWQSIARRLVKLRPDWAVALVDLRGHGDSTELDGPDTFEQCGTDLAGLVESIAPPVRALLGHSFGGKVALAMLRHEPETLRWAWVVDVSPGPREKSGMPWRVLTLLRDYPGPFESRQDTVSSLIQEGLSRPVAMWLATNLESGEDGWRWTIDPDVMEKLLTGYAEADLWSVMESPPEGVSIGVVRAERDSLIPDEDVDRMKEAVAVFKTLPGGHWLHAEQPEPLVELLAETLPGDGG